MLRTFAACSLLLDKHSSGLVAVFPSYESVELLSLLLVSDCGRMCYFVGARGVAVNQVVQPHFMSWTSASVGTAL